MRLSEKIVWLCDSSLLPFHFVDISDSLRKLLHDGCIFQYSIITVMDRQFFIAKIFPQWDCNFSVSFINVSALFSISRILWRFTVRIEFEILIDCLVLFAFFARICNSFFHSHIIALMNDTINGFNIYQLVWQLQLEISFDEDL